MRGSPHPPSEDADRVHHAETFAGVSLETRFADVSFILPEAVDSSRIKRLDLYGPTSFAHSVRIRETDEIDAELGKWLCAAYERGLQITLDPHARVEPLVGATLSKLRIPVRGSVVEVGNERSLRVPLHAAQALGAHPHAIAQIGRERQHANVTESDGAGLVTFPRPTLGELGLGAGDTQDVVLSADI